MRETGKGELSPDLAERLPAALRQALDHPCRRGTLRTLREDGEELSATELRHRGCATCTLSCVTYHLGVLIEAGLVRRQNAGSVGGRIEYTFAAVPGEQPAVADVLQATEAADGRRPEPAQA